MRTIPTSLLIAALLLAACPKKADDKAEKGTPGAAGAASSADAADEAFGLYIKGYNELIDDMKRAVQAFEREFPEPVTAAPARRPIFVLGAGPQFAIEKTEEAWAEAKKVAPKELADMAPMAEAILVAARALDKDLSEAEVYYKAEKYKDDNGAGAVELDGRIRGRIKTYYEALDKLDTRLKAREIEELTADLAKFPDEKTYSHQFRAFGLVARRFMDAADAGPEKLVEAYPAVDAANTKIKAFANAKPKHPGSFDGYMHQVDNFYAQATKMNRDVKDKAPAEKLNQDFTLLVSYYNSLISLTNSLYQLEGQGILK